jgi:hypothetical protein
MRYYSNETPQKRNWNEERERSKENVNSEVIVTKMTEEDWKKCEAFNPALEKVSKWTDRV